ncbi:MAG: hypothetical protein LBU58_05870, partial [Clostridiales bacterium]|nr:hypothetical protein [Clostridiales bacterium]
MAVQRETYTTADTDTHTGTQASVHTNSHTSIDTNTRAAMTAGQAGARGVRRGRTAYPSLAEARALAPGNTLVPISIEIFADRKTPVEALRAVSAGGREAYLLESAPDGDNWGRYTFIGYDP